MNPVFEAFLKSRRLDITREYSLNIYGFLQTYTTHDNEGWIRARDIRDEIVPKIIPNASSFYKLLSDMEQYKVIEKETVTPDTPHRGKNPVYYRLTRRAA